MLFRALNYQIFPEPRDLLAAVLEIQDRWQLEVNKLMRRVIQLAAKGTPAFPKTTHHRRPGHPPRARCQWPPILQGAREMTLSPRKIILARVSDACWI
ncbi:hypothetical protein E2C01_077322 [Portunus trituberculatus]|uniref:Uncharacterized protein n=1 Tax=Portunus trituberculatus TaxID=210409 RepID=A0A5B7ILV0_PORTR|nr:hypothetical protein [Portunus trituberculatus]